MNTKSEFIGSSVEISEQNITGKIIDETKNTFTIETKKGNKTIIKNNTTFKINGTIIYGKDITKKPEDRTK